MTVLEITVEETEMGWSYGDQSGWMELRTSGGKEITDNINRIVKWFPEAEQVLVNGEEL